MEVKWTAHRYAVELLENLNEAHSFARERLGRAAMRQKSVYDRNAKGWTLEPGTAVWLFNPRGNHGVPRKFKKYWEEGWRVTRKRSQILFDITNEKGATQTVHLDRLRKEVRRQDASEVDDDVVHQDDATADDEQVADDAPQMDVATSDEEDDLPTTRAGRKIRAPQYYCPYVL